MEPLILPESKVEELFRRHGAGVFEDGKIKIHPLEALYFIERGLLSLEHETFDSLFSKIKKEDKLAEEKYMVLRHLRRNGYIVRPSFTSERWLRVYRKGFRPGEDRTQYLIKIVEKGWKPEVDEMLADVKKAAEVRKELIYAYVEKGKPTFLKLARTSFD